MGGDDQWSNIIAGVELTRRKTGRAAYGLTNKLLLKSDGTKMGKTAGGALWLDAEKVSPYDFYQYWRNVDDADVRTCLCLLTFVPMEEVNRLASLEGAAINEAKQVLAYEVTKLVHGEEAANLAQIAALKMFSQQDADNIPAIEVADANGKKLLDVLAAAKIIASKAEGRRLIAQNGLTLNDEKVSDADYVLGSADFVDGAIVIRVGKKKFFKVVNA